MAVPEKNLTKNKFVLAKLLAKENLFVEHRNVPTAYMDLKERQLILPNWLNIDADLYDLLVGHETGHAIDTPMVEWEKEISRLSEKFNGPFVDQKAKEKSYRSIQGFVNIIEDVRIEKRQKERYPGLRKPFASGYSQLHAQDFFNLKKAKIDIAKMSFIDRANLFYKGGGNLNIQFTEVEQDFIDRMLVTQTFSDVVKLAEEIYKIAKDGGETGQNSQPQGGGRKKGRRDPNAEYVESDDDSDGAGSDGDEEDADSDGDQGSGKKETPGTGEGNSSGKSGDEKDKEDAEGNGKSGKDGKSEKDKEQSEKNGTQKGQSSKAPTAGGGSAGSSAGELPVAITEAILSENLKTLADSSKVFYYDIPDFNYKKVVVPFKETLNKLETNWRSASHDDKTRDKMQKNSAKLIALDKPIVSFMAKEFEMKKAAAAYVRSLSAKTGVVNTNRLHSYKITDDIFKRVTITPDGKNHGFIMLLDWSGSMSGNIHATICQLVTLTSFCRQVNVPFQVFSFVSANNWERQNLLPGQKNGNFTNLNNFFLRELLSSKMNRSQYNKAINYLLMIGVVGRNSISLDPMGGTPLNPALLALSGIVEEFKKNNSIEIMNVIVMTDGQSEPLITFDSGGLYHSNKNGPKAFIRKRNKQWNIGFGYYEQTKASLNILKDRTGSNLLGINFVSGSPNAGGKMINMTEKESKSWKDEGFIPVEIASGYDVEYVMNQRFFQEAMTPAFVVAGGSVSNISKEFAIAQGKRKRSRVLARSIIDQVVI